MSKYIFNLMIFSVALVMAFTARAQSRLDAGESIYSPGSLTSDNGIYRLNVQSDGNLVLYKNNNPLWASSTDGVGDVVLSMQTDGNLVLYRLSSWQPVWSSGTWNIGDGARLSVQNDGNTVIYDGNWSAKWSTGTWQAPEPSYTTLQNPPQNTRMEVKNNNQCIRFSKSVFLIGTSQSLFNVVGVEKGGCIDFKVQLKGGTTNQYYLTTSNDWHEGENYRYLSNTGSNNNGKNVNFTSTGFNGTSKFIWRFVNKGNGFYQIVSINSGKCLDVGSDGKLQQYNCHDGSNQQFYISGS